MVIAFQATSWVLHMPTLEAWAWHPCCKTVIESQEERVRKGKMGKGESGKKQFTNCMVAKTPMNLSFPLSLFSLFPFLHLSNSHNLMPTEFRCAQPPAIRVAPLRGSLSDVRPRTFPSSYRWNPSDRRALCGTVASLRSLTRESVVGGLKGMPAGWAASEAADPTSPA